MRKAYGSTPKRFTVSEDGRQLSDGRLDELSLGVVCTADPSVEAIASSTLEGSNSPAPAAAGVSTFGSCSAGMRKEVGMDTGELQPSRRSSIRAAAFGKHQRERG